MNVKFKRSNRKYKKYMAIFGDGNKIHFGDNRYDDYTSHKDITRKNRYLARHRTRENWNDFQSSGSLSRWILWNKPTLREAIKDYKKRFKLT
tara:strand:- start:52 stop:327 length:276 start_codon:yes stop_codon:yes gene_type:complete